MPFIERLSDGAIRFWLLHPTYWRSRTHVQGVLTKILSERLRKLTTYGLLAKHVYAEMPPRTEYSLTQNGQKLVGIIGQLQLLDDEIKSAEQGVPAGAKKRCR